MMDVEKRAVAAEKTVAVLKKKVFELYNGDKGSMDRALEAAKRREEENRKKREIAEVRAGELARYSQTLEAEVVRRTEAIKMILDNVTFGFLVVDRALIVQPESTKSCIGLFGTSVVEGKPLSDLLGLPPRQAQELRLGVDQVWDDILPDAVSLGQLQQKFRLADDRVLRVEGSVIRSADGTIRALLFTISDITALEAATLESAVNRTLVGILKQKEAFQSFLIETQHQLKSASVALQDGDDAYVRRVVHTVKGNAASYGLIDVVTLTHAIEEKDRVTADDLIAVADAFRAFLRKHVAVLDLDFDRVSEAGCFVSEEQIKELRQVAVGLPAEAARKLELWTARVVSKPAHNMLGPIDDFTEKLGDRLGKEIDFEIHGADTIVDVETMRPVLMSLSHLIRNSVDHGIEPPRERTEKARRGRIRVSIADKNTSWQIFVEDDGRGIDFRTLHQKAVDRGVASKEQIDKMPNRGIDLVFIDGLSTAATTTQISGRGIGMSAVRSAVTGARGNMAIESKDGQGTVVKLEIPKPAANRGASRDG